MAKEFLSLNKNDDFAFLRGLDLQELLIETESYFLEYRDKLNLPDDVTFGVEIEYEGISKTDTDEYIQKNLNQWNSKCDASLDSGGEVTSPVMIDTPKCWKELQMICNNLTRRKADTLHNAGGHIHIGAYVLGDDVEAWQHFLKLYIAYENVLFRFAYGDKINGRKELMRFAYPRANRLYQMLDKINKSITLDHVRSVINSDSKYNAVNFGHVRFDNPNYICDKNTIEFRNPNSTTNEVIWQNNINAFAKMLVASSLKVMNEDFLDYKLKKEFHKYSGDGYYNNVNLKNALEFVDLVFDNNLDKIYFLRQYLKNFEDNYGIAKTVDAKRFVK